MRYTLRYSDQALRDMDSVWDGVVEASGSVDVAEEYIHGLVARVDEMIPFPRSGIPLLHRGVFTGYYSVNFKAYKVFYTVMDQKQEIEVARVLLAKSDYMRILF